MEKIRRRKAQVIDFELMRLRRLLKERRDRELFDVVAHGQRARRMGRPPRFRPLRDLISAAVQRARPGSALAATRSKAAELAAQVRNEAHTVPPRVSR